MTKEEFEEYKLLHDFEYPEEPLKKWINETNASNLYKENWGCLMPVVEKIDSIGASVIIGRMFCDIKYIDPLNESINFDIRIASGVKINAVSKAVVEFVKWYKTQ